MASQLLFCWISSHLSVLVPKKRGTGFLAVPYGHHYNQALTDIGNVARCDVTGLDGSLMFRCGKGIRADFHLDEATKKSFADIVIPRLEKHYDIQAKEVDLQEYWQNHPSKNVFGCRD